jgi:hypothetical protein
MACNGVRSEADGATNGATDGPFFRLPNEFAGNFVEGSLPDGCTQTARPRRAVFF